MRASKQSQQFARQLYRLSLENDQVAVERVGAVLAYLRDHPPREALAVLREYRRLVARQLARSHAVVEHAGAISDAILRGIADTLSRRYARPVTATAKIEPRLIAGLRIRIGDDLYESSIAGQLSTLKAAT